MAASSSSSAATIAAADVFAQQSALIADAAEAIPHRFDTCTYSLGPLRQPVFACLTCTPPPPRNLNGDASARKDWEKMAGICASCSVSCHGDHEQVELFNKRNFTCDCPTRRYHEPCKLSIPGSAGASIGHQKEEKNQNNLYGSNYWGRFCRCGREYDPEKEQETMVQCLACEDWLHESCLNLREKPSSRVSTPAPDVPQSSELRAHDQAPSSSNGLESIASALLGRRNSSLTDTTGEANNCEDIDDDDDDNDEEEDSLPPALLVSDDYESLICSVCFLKMRDVLLPYAGQPGSGYAVVARRDGGPWEVLGGKTSPEDDKSVEVDATTKQELSQDGATLNPAKRRRTSDAVSPDPKRARADPALGSSSGDGYGSSAGDQVAQAHGGISDTTTVATCLKPNPEPLASAVLTRQKTDPPSTWETAGDLFLPDDFRTRWCRCFNCVAKLSQYPYLLVEETTYEPPPDPDRGRSLEELGMAALATMPREKALDGVRAFQTMKDEVMSFLRPFATDGRVVSAQDITKFFEERTEELARRARNRGM